MKAFRYLVKPIKHESLRNLFLSDYYEHYRKRYIVFPQGAKYTSVFSAHIINLETSGRKTAGCLKKEIFFLTCKMTGITDILPEDTFVHCHQSYIINMQNVIEIKRDQAKCVEGKIVPISRKYLSVVQERFFCLKNRGL